MSTDLGGEGREEVSMVTRVQMAWKGAVMQDIRKHRQALILSLLLVALTRLEHGSHPVLSEQAGHPPVKPVHGGKLAAEIT